MNDNNSREPEMPAIHILSEDEIADQRTYSEAVEKMRDLIRTGRKTDIYMGPAIPLTQYASFRESEENA